MLILRLVLALVVVTPALSAGFLENRGQLDPAVLYYAGGSGLTAFFTCDGLVLEIAAPGDPLVEDDVLPSRLRERRTSRAVRRHVVRVRFAERDASCDVRGLERLPGRYGFLLGTHAAGGAFDVGAFDAVAYHDVRPGVDLLWRIDGRGLSWALDGVTGAAPPAIDFAYEGASPRRLDDRTARIETPLGAIVERRAPDGLRGDLALPALEPPPAASEVASADHLRWSTVLGGTRDETVHAVALDAASRPTVAGTTRSIVFPTTTGALDTGYDGSFDGFVARLSADGATLLWSTFLGSSGDDRVWALRLDDLGRPLVAGVTGSPAFPVTAGAYDVSHNGNYDAFAALLEADGSRLVWSTFLGGADREWDVSGLDLDGAGRVWLSGSTRSADLPVTTQAFDATLDGLTDGFVARLSADGGILDWATYLGGGGSDAIEDLAVDAAGRPVVVGHTSSGDFPATAGAFQTSPPSAPATTDAFVARVSEDGDALEFATYLGGAEADEAFAIALDGTGAAIVAGASESGDFPATALPPSGLLDAFVVRLAPEGDALDWGSMLGGSSAERALDLALDPSGRPLVVGWTCSEDFPTPGDPYDESFNGLCDAFLARCSADGSEIVYGSYFGGWRDDAAYALGLDALGRPVLGGEAWSSDFPTTPGSFDPTHNSPDDDYDAFVLALWPMTTCVQVSGGATPTLLLGKAHAGDCEAGPPLGQAIDVIQGHVEWLAATDIGVVEPLACDTEEVVFENAAVPLPSRALFQLARFAGGSYADGGGPGLVGQRVPLEGDCP